LLINPYIIKERWKKRKYEMSQKKKKAGPEKFFDPAITF